ncbi:hypothetical protein [Streptomyces sp. NPDC058739]|uniref:hypothetical protein n=1 Tax=Streptomyces sp. NPDC058739 TaxID=3346618 RepID=UPI00369FF1F1
MTVQTALELGLEPRRDLPVRPAPPPQQNEIGDEARLGVGAAESTLAVVDGCPNTPIEVTLAR